MIYDFPAVKDTLMQRARALESEPCCMERGVKGVSFCNSNSDLEYYVYPSPVTMITMTSTRSCCFTDSRCEPSDNSYLVFRD